MPSSPKQQVSTLLFDSLPPKTFIGLDLLSFNSSLNFRGIQNIPAGIHFLYSGTDASLSIRHGHWLPLTAACTQVFRWDAQEERLSSLSPTDEAFKHATASLLGQRATGLIDYPALVEASLSKQDNQDKISTDDWQTLSSHITSQTLDRIFSSPYSTSSISSAPQDNDVIPGLEHSEVVQSLAAQDETPLNFIPIDLKRTWPAAAVGRERTEAARDRSWYLGHLLDKLVPMSLPQERARAAGELLGELQICFLMVLTLVNYSCLEQWKRLLGVLLTCRTALGEVEEFFVELLQVLRLQLRHCEDVDGGLFEFKDEGSRNWLKALLRGFKSASGEVLGGNDNLACEFSEIEDLMRERYGWEVESAMLRRGVVELEDGERAELTMDGADEEDEMGEYAPVYVET